MQEFRLPDLGEGMVEAEVRNWLVRPGDTIKAYEPMVQVETNKSLMDIPSPVSGRVLEIRVPAGQVAKKGEVLVIFAEAGNGAATPPPPTSRETGAPAPTVGKAVRAACWPHPLCAGSPLSWASIWSRSAPPILTGASPLKMFAPTPPAHRKRGPLP